MRNTQAAEVALHIVGAFPFSFPWYTDMVLESIEFDGQIENDAWSISWFDPSRQADHKTDAERLTQVMTQIVEVFTRGTNDAWEALGTTFKCARQCALFLAGGDRDAVDFDADTADEVVQVAAYGYVLYG